MCWGVIGGIYVLGVVIGVLLPWGCVGGSYWGSSAVGDVLGVVIGVLLSWGCVGG